MEKINLLFCGLNELEEVNWKTIVRAFLTDERFNFPPYILENTLPTDHTVIDGNYFEYIEPSIVHLRTIIREIEDFIIVIDFSEPDTWEQIFFENDGTFKYFEVVGIKKINVCCKIIPQWIGEDSGNLARQKSDAVQIVKEKLKMLGE